jgi:hypothetical protein
MINPVKILLILLILIFINGCVCFKKHPIKPAEPIIIHQKFESCPVPGTPTYKDAKNGLHIGSKENLDIIIDNMLKDKYYINSLNNCIKCYESQIKEGK